MVKPAITILLLSIPIFSGGSANAQVRVLGEEEAVSIAIRNSYEIAARTASADAARSLESSAFELPKTQVTGEYGNNEGFAYNDGIMISQSIPFPTLFGARRELFEQQTRIRDEERELSALAVRRSVRGYYYQLEYLQHNAERLNHLDSIYTDFVRIAELRFKTGDTKKTDIQAAMVKQMEIRSLVQQNEVYHENTYQALKAILQLQEDFKIVDRPFEPLQMALSNDTTELGEHPQVKIFQQNAIAAEKSKRVERAQAAPDISLAYSNISLIGTLERNGVERYYDRSQRFSYVNLGLSIPLTYGATRARIKAFDHQQEAAEAAARQQLQELNIEVHNAMNRYAQLRKQYDLYRSTALPNIEDMINAARLSYKAGESSGIEYLYTLGTAAEMQLKYLELIQQLNGSVILIRSLINK